MAKLWALLILVSGVFRAEPDDVRSHRFHFVEKQKNWTEAQAYCRLKFSDLATIRSQHENLALTSDPKAVDNWVWIGLYRNSSGWVWSDGSNSSYRNWEPGAGDGHDEFCTEGRFRETYKDSKGLWNDKSCQTPRAFVCQENGADLTLVHLNKTWEEALEYCSSRSLELVSVIGQHTQTRVQVLAQGASSPKVWLGLRYSCTLDAWFWVGPGSSGFTSWALEEGGEQKECGRSGAMERKGSGKWFSVADSTKLNFICSPCRHDDDQ